MEKNLKFNTIISEIKDVEIVNPMFTRAKVYALYVNENRNNSYISKDAVLKSMSTLYGIPIIGEYLVEKDNFGGHGGRLEITDTDIKYVQTTVPFGYVPESVKTSWEIVTEKDGTENEYLVLDGVYLWTGRYSELNVLLEHGKLGQSMEIEVDDGSFAVINGKEVFKIEKFTFSALCMLGIDKGSNSDDHIEPCFESASIITYNLNKDAFKREFQQMLSELKYSLDKGGNTEMEQVNQETVETTEVVVVEDSQIEEVQVTDTVEESFEQTEEVVDETVESTETESTDEVVTEEVTEEFTETTEEVIESVEGGRVDDTVVEPTEDYEVKFNELTENYNAVLVELAQLKEFKRNALESELASKFVGQLSQDELKDVFTNSKEKTLEDVEKELFALVGKKNFSISKTESTKIKVAFSTGEEKEPNPYGDFFK